MTWRHPRKIPRAGETVDFDDTNDAVRHVHDELGALNEHNFGSDLKTELTAADLADDAITRTYRVRLASPTHFGDWGTRKDSDAKVQSDGEWKPIGSMEAEVVSLGGSMSVRVSMQVITGQSWQDVNENSTSYYRNFNPIWVVPGIEVNGRVVVESQQGDLDHIYSGGAMERGYGGLGFSIYQEISLTLPAGRHTIRPVLRMERGPKKADNEQTGLATASAIAWHMRDTQAYRNFAPYYTGPGIPLMEVVRDRPDGYVEYVKVPYAEMYIREDR